MIIIYYMMYSYILYIIEVIKTAAFCHNRALQDPYPCSYRLLFTTGSFTLTTSPFSNEPDVQRIQRVRTKR